MFPGAYQKLHLMALDSYDLPRSKLETNSQKDRDDVRFLARGIPLDLDVLQARYTAELPTLKPVRTLPNPDRPMIRDPRSVLPWNVVNLSQALHFWINPE
jgi:hypothetical protein